MFSRQLTFICNFTRVNTYIRNGWDTKQLVDPDHPCSSAREDASLVPTDGWQEITQAYMHLPPQQVIAFTNAQMISYFVTRTADDGMPVGDFKSLNKSVYCIFHCGHVQEVEVCQESGSNTLRPCNLPARNEETYSVQNCNEVG